MNISFATCDISRAITFLKTGYLTKDLRPETLPKLCDGLRRDVVRITDPQFHALALKTGKNYTDKDESLLYEIASEIKNAPEEK